MYNVAICLDIQGRKKKRNETKRKKRRINVKEEKIQKAMLHILYRPTL